MALSIKAKQVAGVTTIVGFAVVVLSAIHLTRLARLDLQESESRGQMLANALYQRARDAVRGQPDPYAAIRDDPGVRSILESSIAYSKNVTYAAVVDPSGVAVAHSFRSLDGTTLPRQEALGALMSRSPVAQLRAIYSDRTFEVNQPLLLGSRQFGSIRIGISTLLVRQDLQEALRPAAVTALVALVVAMLVAMLLAQWMLQPIHVIRSGLSRLGRGEFDVKLDLPPGEEFGELERSFDTISAKLAVVKDELASDNARPEAVAERLDTAIRYSRKLAALGRLFAGVAHELKNPLNAMTIHLELLKQKVSESEAKRHATLIGQEIRRLDKAIQGFLKFTRPAELRLEPVMLPGLVEDVLRLLRPEAEKTGVTMTTEYEADLPAISADADMLRQALLNLALNACQAMPNGGTLRIACRTTSDQQVEVLVEDTGTGIKPEHLERIFELYFTTKEDGSGIGLSMVYRTIQLHDGEIEVQSTPGRGTIFRILLPKI